ncbi:MAG: bifunctional diguanylate cyclase/phosphodiesterase [Alcanivoracaceae bacterium]|nr:bifunctional diguanylate cyclase/phosphodiesterase [Alcanivoracaceae bacterium]
MFDLTEKSALICSNLKNERLLSFNFFDNNESAMIHTAKNVKSCAEILASEEIDYFIIECSKELIHNPQQLTVLINKYSAMKVVLLINKKITLHETTFTQFQEITDVILFEPLSPLEIDSKLTQLCSQNGEEKPQTMKVPEIMDNASDAENSQELWNMFFIDSLQAKLIVNAVDQKIMHVNDALLDFFQQKERNIVGRSWKSLDNKVNHAQYQQYIKEINSEEKTRFIINNTNANKTQNFEAEYQMGVLNGEIIFMGVITPENIRGISNEVFLDIEKINQTEVFSAEFPALLDDIRKSLKFRFLMFFEYRKRKLLKPVISGDKNFVKKFLNRSIEPLLVLINSNNELQIDRNNNRMSEYFEILDANSLQSICVYPIFHQNKTYGSIIAGGLTPIDNWQTISVVLKSLVYQCRFSLFQKTIVDQREIEGQLDSLTGLPNRNSMTSKFTQIIEKGISSEKYISLMIIDIEKLNYLNKNLGIELTDEIIVCTAKILKQGVRGAGQVYRLSGDEFVILMHPHTDKKLVEFKVVDLIKKMNHPILLSNGKSIDINFNIGISVFPDDGQTVSSMMKNADLAMYDARLAGKNNYVIFKYSETGQALKQKIEMEENLKKAIDEDHIKVFFQPKINAATEDIIGFEALVRWIDPDIGMINPGHFIPLAEETGLINEIGEYVAKQSCKLIVDWQKRYGLTLTCSINLSAVQLIDPELPKKLEAIINSSGVHPHYIDFEITETISLDVVPNLVESLNEIVAIGCTLSIDDFGTGHSSLDYIKKIPAQFIKIDQSFVCNIGLNPEDEAILDATIDIAKRLNRQIVAEGVETEEQREYLLERGCDYFQGFLFARPMPEEEIEKLLQQRVKLMGTN